MCLRLARAGALAFVLLALHVPTSSQAFDTYYDCYLKPSNQWCDGRANGSFDGLDSWDYSEAWYPGTWDNTVTACERIYNPSTGVTLGPGSSCAYNWTAQLYGNITFSGWEANAKQISGGAHSIHGYADSNY